MAEYIVISNPLAELPFKLEKQVGYDCYVLTTSIPNCRVCRLVKGKPCGCYNAQVLPNGNCPCAPKMEAPIVLVKY